MLKLKKAEELLFFLVILFLPTQLGRHFWPQFSHIYSLRIDYLSPTVYFWDLLLIALFITWLIRKPNINKLAFNLLLLFLLSQTISLTYDNLAGLVRLYQYVIVGLFGVYVASSNVKTQMSKLYLPLSLALLGESVLAIAQFLKGGAIGLWILGERNFSLITPAIAKFDFYGSEFLRPYGTFPHPNVLAAFLLISLLLTKIGLLTEIGLLMTKIRINIINIIAVLAIILTFSRTALVATIFALFFILRKKYLILLGLVVLSPVLFVRFSSLLNFDNLTLLRREELAYTALSLWKQAPLLGVGLNNFIPTAADFLLSGPARFLQPVHNIFLLTLSETGILGLLGFLVLIGYPIFKKKLLLVWGVIIFLGMFDHYFITLPQGYRLLFLVWGLSLSRLS